MMIYRLLTVMLLTLLSCQSKQDLPVTLDIHQNWQFKATNDSVWRAAEVPGNIHADLWHNHIIAHPFIGSNEDSLQWISDTPWEYQTSFTINEEVRNKKHIELDFQGLDTYAKIYLNDSLILSTDNAFRAFSVDIKALAKPQNQLKILFQPTAISEENKQASLQYQLPEGNRIFTRKAQFQYGWDWGPKLNTCGIWRPIVLNAWNDFKIKNLHIKQLKLADTEALLGINFQNASNYQEPLDYDLYLNGKLHKTYKDRVTPKKFDFQPLLIAITNPKRWWPHNVGDPYLYDIKVVVRRNKTVLDSVSIKKGLRTIELVTEKDSLGESFYFKVNDQPVYMKGANYIPQNSMQSAVSEDHYQQLLSDVVDANMNMLRVWGGGIYENELFYELCDKKGILVWQDFMFACAMYPGDKAFLSNVRKEANYQLKRLRNHASIALWCGNNESSEGWNRWGWQDGRTDAEKSEIWHNYKRLFQDILPKAVALNTDTPYWESSPKYGRGNPRYLTEGDAHDWWVWHDGYPFEHFETNVPRFMSEFGFQSFPSEETINYINQKDTLDISTEALKNHQKHRIGFERIQDYMAQDFPVPKDAADYLYVSQLVQAHGITKGIEAHRRAKPYNMGSLYWQLNDCWPAISWSSIDFFGNWKALHYRAKSSFENFIISYEAAEDNIQIIAINDYLKDMPVDLNMSLMDFNGTIIWEQQLSEHIASNSTQAIFTLDINDRNFDRSACVLITSFNKKKWLYYFSKPKDLKLVTAPIAQSVKKTKTGYRITLSSDVLQKSVYLHTTTEGRFSDNFFDILPRTPITINFETTANQLENLQLTSLNQLIQR